MALATAFCESGEPSVATRMRWNMRFSSDGMPSLRHRPAAREAGEKKPRRVGGPWLREKGVCECGPNPHPEPGFRWARAARLRVHLTRDDHTCQAIYQALLRRALVQGNIEPSLAPQTGPILRPSLAQRVFFGRGSEQVAVAGQRLVEPQDELRGMRVVGAVVGPGLDGLRRRGGFG